MVTAIVILLAGVLTSVGLTLGSTVLRGQSTRSASVAASARGVGQFGTPTLTPITTEPTTINTENDSLDGAAADSAAAQARLDRALPAYLRRRPGTATVMAVNASTGVAVSSGAHTSSYTASIVKLDILLTLLLQRQDDGTMPTSTEETLARRMIIISDNNAASSLWQRIGGADGLSSANRRFGLTETVPGPGNLWGLTRTTASDQIRLLSVAFGTSDALVRSGVAGQANVLSKAKRAFAIRLLEQVDQTQTWGVSAADDAQDTALKNGWFPLSKDGNRWQVNSVGRIRTTDGSRVLIAVLTRGSASLDYGIATVEQASVLTMAALKGS